jgi:hypothetical protein
MLSWLNPAQYRRPLHIHQVTGNKKFDRFTIESLENRTMLSAALATPTLLDPIVAYPGRSEFVQPFAARSRQPAKNTAPQSSAYRRHQPKWGLQRRRGRSGSAGGGRPRRALPSPCRSRSDSRRQQPVLHRRQGFRRRLRSAPLKDPLITEDSKAPTVTGITRVGTATDQRQLGAVPGQLQRSGKRCRTRTTFRWSRSGSVSPAEP